MSGPYELTLIISNEIPLNALYISLNAPEMTVRLSMDVEPEVLTILDRQLSLAIADVVDHARQDAG